MPEPPRTVLANTYANHPAVGVRRQMQKRRWSDAYTRVMLGWSVDQFEAFMQESLRLNERMAHDLGRLFGASPEKLLAWDAAYWQWLGDAGDQMVRPLGAQ